mgnify:CR=1 FL=1
MRADSIANNKVRRNRGRKIFDRNMSVIVLSYSKYKSVIAGGKT